MKKVFWAVLLAALTTGCATAVYPDGTRRRVPMPQVGVIVTVTNNCSAFIQVEHGAVSLVGPIPYGRSARLPVSSLAYSGTSRSISLEAKAYDGQSRYIGSVSRGFQVSIQRGTREVPVWQVDRLNSPSGVRCQPPG